LRGITGMLFQVGVEKESGGKYSECEFWRSWKHWLCWRCWRGLVNELGNTWLLCWRPACLKLATAQNPVHGELSKNQIVVEAFRTSDTWHFPATALSPCKEVCAHSSAR